MQIKPPTLYYIVFLISFCIITPSNEEPRFDVSTNEYEETVLSLDEAENVFYYIPSEQMFSNKRTAMIYAYSDTANVFSMESVHEQSGTVILQRKAFHNGYAVIVDLASYSDINETKVKFTITPSQTNSVYKVNSGLKYIDSTHSSPIPFKLMETVYGFTETQHINELCYTLNETSISDDDNNNVYLFANVYSQYMRVEVKEKTSLNTVFVYDLYFNNYVILSSDVYNKDTHIICFNSEAQQNEYLSFTFQLIPESYLINNSPKLIDVSPLINGVQNIHYIPNNGLIYYRHRSFEGESLNIHLTVLEGNAMLYGYLCETFPSCDISITGISSMKTAFKLGNEYLINEHNMIKDKELFFDNTHQYFAVVYCNNTESSTNEGCKYIINMNSEKDEIELLAYTEYANVIQQEEQLYSFKLVDLTNIEQITFSIQATFGNVELYIYDEQHTLIEDVNVELFSTKQIYTITSNLKHEYHLVAKTTSDVAFYSIKVELNVLRRTSLQRGMTYIEQLTLNKVSIFQFENALRGKDFQLNVNAQHCIVDLVYDSNSLNKENKQSFHSIIKSDTLSIMFSLSIKEHLYQNKDKCNVIVYGNYISNEEPITLLTENTRHPVIINNGVDSVVYAFPIIKHNDNSNIMLMTIEELTVDTSVTVQVTINDRQYLNKEVNAGHDRTFVIDKSKLNDDIKEDEILIGKVTITRITQAESDISMLLSIDYKNKTPMYFNKNEFIKAQLLPQEIKYFYTDIYYNGNDEDDELQEIEIVFEHSYGEAYAKIVSKDYIENKEKVDWGGRVILPNKDETESNEYKQILTFNTNSNSFTFKLTELPSTLCASGCELYVAVLSNETITSSKQTSFNEIQLIYRSSSDVSQINIDQTIKGSLQNDQCRYYNIHITKDFDKLQINFNTLFAVLYINTDNTKPSSTNHKFELNTDETSLLLYAFDVIKGNTFNNVNFTVGVCIEGGKYVKGYNYYSFSFDPQFTGNNYTNKYTHYGVTDSINLSTDNGVLVIPFNGYNSITKAVFYVYDQIDMSQKYTINGMVVNFTDIDKNNYDYLKSLIQTESLYNFSSLHSNEITIQYDLNDVYVILSIKKESTTASSTINVISSYYDIGFKSTSLLPYMGNSQLYCIHPNTNSSFYVFDSEENIEEPNKYSYSIYTLKGNGSVFQHNLLPNMYVNLNEHNHLIINNTGTSELLVLIQYKLIKESINFDQMALNVKNSMSYNSIQMPFAFYFKTRSTININNVKINIRDVYYSEQKSNGNLITDKLNIALYQIDNNFIQNKIRDNNVLPISTPSFAKYFLEENIAMFTHEQFKNDEYSEFTYYYISLEDPQPNRSGRYSFTSEYLISSASDNKINIVPNEYTYGLYTTETLTYKLTPEHPNDTYYYIEFAEAMIHHESYDENGYLSYVIVSEVETTITSEEKVNGKHVMILSTVQNHNIEMIIRKSQTVSYTVPQVEYVIKYKSFNSKDNLPSINKLNVPTCTKQQTKNYKCTINIPNADTVKLTLKGYNISEYKNITSTICDNFNTTKLKYIYHKTESFDYTQTFSFSIPAEQVHLSLVLSYYKHPTEEIKEAYDVVVISETAAENSSWAVFLIITILVLLILGMLCYCRHLKAKNNRLGVMNAGISNMLNNYEEYDE